LFLPQADDYSAVDREHMYTTGGAEVFNVEAAQEAEVKIPSPPPRQAKSRSMKREVKVLVPKAETENRAPPAAASQAPPADKGKEMPAEVASALALLDPDHPPEIILSACQTLLDYADSFRDFRRQRPDEARAIQRKGFKLLEMKHNRVQARLSRLALKVAGNLDNITSVTKLIFRLSKDEANDVLFIEEGLIDEVTRLLELHGKEKELPIDGKIFAVGVLKNTALSKGSQAHMINSGIVGVLANVLQQQEESKGPGDRNAQLLVQVTGALRNISGCTGDLLTTVQKDMTEMGVFSRLAWIMENYSTHEELIMNISRMLHKLTLNPECREALISVPHFVGNLLRALVPHIDHLAIVIRICFVLGNITASDGPSRGLIAGAGGVDLLGGILEHYEAKDRLIEEATTGGENPGEEGQKKLDPKKGRDIADVLTKVIRVLANLAIDEAVGPSIAEHSCVSKIVDILDRRRIDSSEELVLNAVSAVTNISFYEGEGNVMLLQQDRIGVRLQPLLLHENDEAVIESVRAYGNFSRALGARDKMVETHVDEVMIMLLDHSNAEVVYSVCGVLMNLVADSKHKDVLSRMDGVNRLIKVVVRSGVADVGLSVIACRALFNYCLDADEEPLEESQAEELYEALTAILERNEEEPVEHAQWPELDEVATKLIAFLAEEEEEEEEEEEGEGEPAE